MHSIISGILLSMVSSIALSEPGHNHHNWHNEKSAFENARVVPNPITWSNNNYKDFDVDVDYLTEKLKELSGVSEVLFKAEPVLINERFSNTKKAFARSFMKNELETFGFEVREHMYGSGINLIAEKPGVSDKVLIISSHYDSVSNAGANDAGTSVVGALEIARLFQGEDFQHTLRIIAFDQEEQRLLGSDAYVRSLSTEEKQNIIGDIQLEMMGYNGRKDGRFHVIDCNKDSSKHLTTHVMEAVSALKLELTRVATCVSLSDHGSFWLHDMPAIVISENFFGGDFDPCYHRKCDVFDERLDLNYTAKIVKAVASAAHVMLNKGN